MATDPSALAEFAADLANACNGSSESLVLMLLNRGAPVDGVDGKFLPLRHAAKNGSTKIVERLLAAGADPTALNRDLPGWPTALHLAAAQGHGAVGLRLIAAGADTTILNNSQETAVQMAIRNRHVRESRELEYPFHTMAVIGRNDLCVAMLKLGHDPLALNRQGQTVIEVAERFQAYDVVHSLKAWVARQEALRVLLEMSDTPMPTTASSKGRLTP